LRVVQLLGCSTFVLSWLIIAIYDLFRVLLGMPSLLHWINDVFLIFGSLAMVITIILAKMEQ